MSQLPIHKQALRDLIKARFNHGQRVGEQVDALIKDALADRAIVHQTFDDNKVLTERTCSIFVVVAAVSVTGSAWLLVLGLAGHGLKDLWQHRTQFVRNTRWWPPFCATVDWVAAGILAGALLMGVPFHG